MVLPKFSVAFVYSSSNTDTGTPCVMASASANSSDMSVLAVGHAKTKAALNPVVEGTRCRQLGMTLLTLADIVMQWLGERLTLGRQFSTERTPQLSLPGRLPSVALRRQFVPPASSSMDRQIDFLARRHERRVLTAVRGRRWDEIHSCTRRPS